MQAGPPQQENEWDDGQGEPGAGEDGRIIGGVRGGREEEAAEEPERARAPGELRDPNVKAHDGTEERVPRHGEHGAQNGHIRAALEYVTDVLDRGEAERGGHGIENAVHDLVKVRVAVDAEIERAELCRLLDRPDDQRGGSGRWRE